MPRPSISIGVLRPIIASATRRAEPTESAQPLPPWPTLSQMPSAPLGPSTGGPSGSIGRAPFQRCAALRRVTPGKPVVEHHVERRLGALVLVLGVAADLGAAGDANALAEAADRDLVALVHQRRARLEVEVLVVVAQRRRHRVAVHGDERQVHAVRLQQQPRVDRRADDDRVEARLGGLAGLRLRRRPLAGVARAQRLVARIVGCLQDAQARLLAGTDLLDVGVEAEDRAGALGLLAQQVRELATVADLVVLRIDAGVQRRRRVQARLDRAARRGVEDDRRDAELGERAHAGLGDGQLAGAAQEDEEALRTLEIEVQPRRQLLQPLAAEVGEAVHAGPIGAVDLRPAGAPPAPGPAERRGVERAGDPHRRVRGEEMARDLGRHARRRPGRDVAGRDQAGVGEAATRGDRAATLEHRHLVAVDGELVGRRHADHAGTDDGDAHLSRAADRCGRRARLRSRGRRRGRRRRARRRARPSARPAARRRAGRAG